MAELKDIRTKLDQIDDEIVRLYIERMDLCAQVGEDKIRTGKKVYDKTREEEKLAAVTDKTDSVVYKQGVYELYEQLLTQSRRLQYQVIQQNGQVYDTGFMKKNQLDTGHASVVFQGVEGAYSHAATKQFFGADVDAYNVRTFQDAITDTIAGKADYAVLPIENSSAGMVGDVYDLLMKYDIYIVAEMVIPVRHALAAAPGATIETIKEVYSHPQALMQCADYLAEHPEWSQISVANTAVAAKKIMAERNPAQAAICSEEAAALYGLDIIQKEINKSANNSTRFVILSADKEFVKDAEKISICLEIPHESGSLYRILSFIIFNGLNMTKIESRPVPDKTWEYRFYIDFEGTLGEPSVNNALLSLTEECRSLKILGNY